MESTRQQQTIPPCSPHCRSDLGGARAGPVRWRAVARRTGTSPEWSGRHIKTQHRSWLVPTQQCYKHMLTISRKKKHSVAKHGTPRKTSSIACLGWVKNQATQKTKIYKNTLRRCQPLHPFQKKPHVTRWQCCLTTIPDIRLVIYDLWLSV